MAVTKDKPAPYAPAATILGLVERYRERGLPKPITSEVLGRAGVPDSLIPRALYALQVLGLVDESGNPAEIFDAIRLASESEYQQRLQEWLNAAYADVLSFVDPQTDDETKIRDAFRSYQPIGQQSRMVTLFLGLCAAAGMAPERPTKSRQPGATKEQRRASPKPLQPATRKRQHSKTHHAKTHHGSGSTGMPPAIDGLLASLPTQGEGWTKGQRDKFIDTFGAVLDFCIPIVEDTPRGVSELEPEEEQA